MKNIQIAIRSFFKKGRHNSIKVLSLGVALAVGLVLIAKVCFEFSYDRFYPDSDCIYQIRANFSVGEKKPQSSSTTSMGIAPGMKAEIPGVQSATRLLVLEGENTLLTPDKNKYKAEIIVADSSIYDVLPAGYWPAMERNACRVRCMRWYRGVWPKKSARERT